VAAFFAAYNAREDEGCFIWTVDQRYLKQQALSLLGEQAKWEKVTSCGSHFEDAFLRQDPSARPFVAPLEPFETSERMSIQQGLFLAANCLDIPFQHVLTSALMETDRRLYRTRIGPGLRIDLLRLLNSMNINEATLFPGIDGFASSLRVSAGLQSQYLLEEQPRAWRP
jgi:hypothetical protein